MNFGVEFPGRSATVADSELQRNKADQISASLLNHPRLSAS
jgi:hypothetical protein